MKLRHLLSFSVLFCLISSPVGADVPDPISTDAGDEIVKNCEAEVSNYLSKDRPDISKKYFQLRASLSLHRLSWLHLKKLDSDGEKNPARYKVEESILSLLNEHEAALKSDPEFKKSADLFREKPFSRKTLSLIISPLTAVMKENKADKKDSPFTLAIEDFKMMEVLSELEDVSLTGSSKMTDEHLKTAKSQSASSMLNLIKIINSSYLNSGKSLLDTSHQLATVENEISKIQNELKTLENNLFEKLKNKSETCRAIAMIESRMEVCDDCRKKKVFSEDFGLKNILEKALYKQLKDSNYTGIRYNDVWLKTDKNTSKNKAVVDAKKIRKEVAKSEKINPSETPNTKDSSKKTEKKKEEEKIIEPDLKSAVTPASEKIKIQPTPEVVEENTKESQTIGNPTQYIEHPEAVILTHSKILQNAKAALKNSKDEVDEFSLMEDYTAEQKQLWGQALLRGEKVFKYKLKNYDSATGKEFINRAPSTAKDEQSIKRELYQKNGKKVYTYSGSLYDVEKNTPLEVTEIIRKHTVTISDENKKDRTYLRALAVALENKDPTFQVGDQYFETKTQKPVETPYFYKEKWIEGLNKLPDEEKVLRFEMETWDKEKKKDCTTVTILNKKEAEFKVFDRVTGKLISHTPTVLGSNLSDQLKNGATPAGEYLFGDIPYFDPASDNGTPLFKKFKEKLKADYNGNFIRLCKVETKNNKLECVPTEIGIHEFLRSEKKARELASTQPNKNNVRRMSDGCINVSTTYFNQLKDDFKKGCSFHVLPEGKENHFVVDQNGKLIVDLKK